MLLGGELMRVHIGEKIKYFRTKSKITQSKLAEGIISESYLSKIETGKIAPPREIVLLLCQKLKINPDATEIDHLQTLCHTWFEHLFYGMKEKATDSYNKIIQNIDNIANTSLITLVELHKLRYFILIQNRKEANKQYEYLQQLNLEGKEIYYWFKFSGYYYFDQLFYNKSLNLFQEATIYIRDVTKRETYDLFYMIALNASKLRKSYLSLENATNALTYYQNNYNLKRCAECHILLGIAYQRINELNKSIDSYQLAAKIANDIDDDNIMAISKQNIGKVYSIRGATEDAIYYYLDSFKARRNFPITKKSFQYLA